MTLARPSPRTAASNGSSCSSRISRVPRWTGAWFSPPSAQRRARPCASRSRRRLREVRRPGARGRRRSPARLARYGSSPYVSSTRPQRGSRVMSSTGARACRAPIASIRRPDRRRPSPRRARRPRRPRPDRLLEYRRAAGEQAVERLLVEDRRDPEPRLLDQEPLDLVAERPPPRAGRGSSPPATPRDLRRCPAEQGARHPAAVERAVPDELERPDRPELGDLLLEGHPRRGGRLDPRGDRAGPASRYAARWLSSALHRSCRSPPTICRSAMA